MQRHYLGCTHGFSGPGWLSSGENSNHQCCQLDGAAEEDMYVRICSPTALHQLALRHVDRGILSVLLQRHMFKSSTNTPPQILTFGSISHKTRSSRRKYKKTEWNISKDLPSFLFCQGDKLRPYLR